MTIEEFRRTRGTRGMTLVVQAYMARYPPGPADQWLADEIGEALAELESALEDGQVKKFKPGLPMGGVHD